MAGNSKEALGPAPALVKHLIRKGADVNIADKAEKNPLEYLSLEMANLVVRYVETFFENLFHQVIKD